MLGNYAEATDDFRKAAELFARSGDSSFVTAEEVYAQTYSTHNTDTPQNYTHKCIHSTYSAPSISTRAQITLTTHTTSAHDSFGL